MTRAAAFASILAAALGARAEAAQGRAAETVLPQAVPPALLAPPAPPAAGNGVLQALTPLTVEGGLSQIPEPRGEPDMSLQALSGARTVLEVAGGAPTSPPTAFVLSAAEQNHEAGTGGAPETHIVSAASDAKLGIPEQRKTADAVREEQGSESGPAAGHALSMAAFDNAGLRPGQEPMVPRMFLQSELHDIGTPLVGAIGWIDLLADRLHPGKTPFGLERDEPLSLARIEADRSMDAMKPARSKDKSLPPQVPLREVLALAEELRARADLGAMLLEAVLTPGDPKAAKWLATIKESFARVAELIPAMIRGAQGLGQIQVSLERASLSSPLVSSYEYWRGAAALRGVQLELEADPGLPEVLLDRGLAARVLDNLIGNAVKFTALEAARRSALNDGYIGRIVVRARRGVSIDDDEYVLVSVEDNGPGIAAEDQARIFEVWFQTGSQAHRDAGTGLGLSIARRLAQAQNGDLRVRSELGRGSTFSFRLRIAGP